MATLALPVLSLSVVPCAPLSLLQWVPLLLYFKLAMAGLDLALPCANHPRADPVWTRCTVLTLALTPARWKSSADVPGVPLPACLTVTVAPERAKAHPNRRLACSFAPEVRSCSPAPRPFSYAALAGALRGCPTRPSHDIVPYEPFACAVSYTRSSHASLWPSLVPSQV